MTRAACPHCSSDCFFKEGPLNPTQSADADILARLPDKTARSYRSVEWRCVRNRGHHGRYFECFDLPNA